MNENPRIRRLKFRSCHRGTKEADLMLGGFFDRYGDSWTDEQITWFEIFLEEQDVDIMAWGLGTGDVPDQFQGPMMDAFKVLDFVEIER